MRACESCISDYGILAHLVDPHLHQRVQALKLDHRLNVSMCFDAFQVLACALHPSLMSRKHQRNERCLAAADVGENVGGGGGEVDGIL